MPWLRFFWVQAGAVYCTCGKFMQPTERNRQLNKARYDVLSIPGYVIKKESCPRCQTWTICAADHVPQSTWYAEESPQAQQWWFQNHSGKMARWWQIPLVFVRHRVDWETDHSIWRNRSGRSFFRGYMARKKSERELLEKNFKCRSYSGAIESAQWVYRSEAKM